MSLTRKELVEGLKRRVNGLYRKPVLFNYLAKEAVEAILDLIIEGLLRDGKVLISGFGVFEVKVIKGRKGRDFETGSLLPLPPRKTVRFRASKELKRRLKS